MSCVHAVVFFVQYGKTIPIKSKVLQPYLESAFESLFQRKSGFIMC